MLVIGLTGGIGSGKTTVAELFTTLGVTIIDTDQIARDIVKPGTAAFKQILEQFGNNILTQEHTLNRASLRKIIFNEPEKRRWLEKLLHPLIREEMKQQIQSVTSPYCIVIIPLLFETDPNPLIHRILVVDAEEKLQLERTCLRDNISQDEAKAILATQANRAVRLNKADDIIENDGNLEDLMRQVRELHESYLKLSKSM